MTKLYNYLVKNGDAVAVGVSAVLFIIFALAIYLGSSSGGYNLNELIDRKDLSDVNCFNPGLWMAIILLVLAIFLTVAGIVSDLFKNIKSGSKSIFGFLGIIVVFIALYFTSSYDSGGRFGAYWGPEFNITEGLSKFISAGLYTMMAMAFISFFLIIFFEIKSFFK